MGLADNDAGHSLRSVFATTAANAQAANVSSCAIAAGKPYLGLSLLAPSRGSSPHSARALLRNSWTWGRERSRIGPDTLRSIGVMHPTDVVTRDREVTQAWARTIFEGGAFAGALADLVR